MYRKVVITAAAYISDPIQILYRARGAKLLYQQKVLHGGYEASAGPFTMTGPIVFDNAIRLGTTSSIDNTRSFEFSLDVAENQPAEEAVEEITSTGVAIAVYNEHGVVVCRNAPKTPANSNPTQTVVPGETTSEPIDVPGETTSEPIDVPGETTSEPVDAPAR